jgi:hypothetical protein
VPPSPLFTPPDQLKWCPLRRWPKVGRRRPRRISAHGKPHPADRSLHVPAEIDLHLADAAVWDAKDLGVPADCQEVPKLVSRLQIADFSGRAPNFGTPQGQRLESVGRAELVSARAEGHLLSEETSKDAVLQGIQADDGTRTHGLLHGKCQRCSRPFAPVRSNRLFPECSPEQANATAPERTLNLAILATPRSAPRARARARRAPQSLCAALKRPPCSPRIAHYLFNFSDGDRQQAAVLLQAKMWGVGRHERHRDALAPGDAP